MGYEEAGQLTEKVRRRPYSVVLFDEIEKAHEDVWNIMLQILDDGRITDSQGRTVDFKNTVIVMTSNIGAKALTAAGAKLGFDADDKKAEADADAAYAQAKETVLAELRQTFRPEFLNRIDDIIVFRALTEQNIEEVARRMLKTVADRMETMDIHLDASDEAVKELAKEGFDPKYGARPLRRAIQSKVEDAVAENQKDVARFSLYHALKTVDYRGAERVVRINGLDTPYWREDIRACVAGGCDSIRIPKTQHAEDVHRVAAAIAEDEKTYGRPEGEVLIIAALESARGVMNALEICESDERLFGIALSGGDYTKDLQTHITGTGIELMGARQQMIIAARAAGVQCFDTVFTDLKDMDGFRKDVENIHLMGFDGKSIINPRQIPIVHEIFTPTQKDIIFAEKVVKEIDSKKALGIGVFTVDGKMIDIAFYDGAKRTIDLAKASGVYKGDL